jgi:hypothetical protein
MSNENWSTETQAMTRICVLESQLDVKGTQLAGLQEKINMLELENLQLKDDVDRLNGLVRNITVGQTDFLDRFK